MQSLRKVLQERNIDLDAPLVRVLPELKGLIAGVEPSKKPWADLRKLTLSISVRLKELMEQSEAFIWVIYRAENSLVRRHAAYSTFCAERLNLVGRYKATMESGIGKLQKASQLLEKQRTHSCAEHLVLISGMQHRMRATQANLTPSIVRTVLRQLHHRQGLMLKTHHQQALIIKKALNSYAQMPAGLTLGIQVQAAAWNRNQLTSIPTPGSRLHKMLTLRGHDTLVPLAFLGGCGIVALRASTNHKKDNWSAFKRLLADLRQKHSQKPRMAFSTTHSKLPTRQLVSLRVMSAGLGTATTVIADLTGIIATMAKSSAETRAMLIHARDAFVKHRRATESPSRVTLFVKALRKLRLRISAHKMTSHHDHFGTSVMLRAAFLKVARRSLYLERVVGRYSTTASSCISTSHDVMVFGEAALLQKDLLLQRKLLEVNALLHAGVQIYAAQYQAIINRNPGSDFTNASQYPLSAAADLASHITSTRTLASNKLHPAFDITSLFNKLINFRKVMEIWSDLKRIQLQRSGRQVSPTNIKRLVERSRRDVTHLNQRLADVISRDSVKRGQLSSRLAKTRGLVRLSSCVQQLQLANAWAPPVSSNLCNNSDALHRILWERRLNPRKSEAELEVLAGRYKDLQTELVDVESELLQVYAILKLKLRQDLQAGRPTMSSKRELYSLVQRELDTLQQIQPSPKLSDLSTLSDSSSSYKPLIENETVLRARLTTERPRRNSKDTRCYLH